MAGLKPLPARKVIKKLEYIGFKQTHQRGSHIYLKHEEGSRIVTIAVHGKKDIPVGTLYNIVTKQAKISVEEFNKI